MKKIFVIPVGIIVFLAVTSIVNADSPWVGFEASFEGIEYLDAFYPNDDGIWVAEASTTGSGTFYFDESEIEVTLKLYSIAFFVNGLKDPGSAVIKAEIWIYDAANTNNGFLCKGKGVGSFGKLNTKKAFGEWKKQRIKGEYKTLGDPDGNKSYLNFSAEFSGKWKNPDLEQDDDDDELK